MKGGMVCAASPASSTRPARIVLASRPRNSYTARRTSTPSLGVNHGASSSQMRSSSAKSSAYSPGSSMNSNRRCRRPLRECMCGRSGSHHWHGDGSQESASRSSGRTSTTSQRSAKPWSSKAMPAAWRTSEFAPSAPTT
jgi:hypothetical protein